MTMRRGPTLEEAIRFAAGKHEGQVLKNGSPFILHPLHVMADPALVTEEERMVAVLHDVIEDCGVSPDELRALGYPEAVVDAVAIMTKLPGDDYEQYIARIAAGPSLPRRVKLADLRHNMDSSRIPDFGSEKDLARQARYERAYGVLQAVEAKALLEDADGLAPVVGDLALAEDGAVGGD